MKRMIAIAIIAIIALTNCKKDDSEPIKPNIYVAGYEFDDANIPYAKVWKNGTEIFEMKNAGARSIALVGNDIFIAGTMLHSSGKYVATLWKNGVPTFLTDGTKSSDAFSVFLLNNDVYVSGNIDDKATFWKNGVATSLSDKNSNAYSVFVSGSDVYVSGSEWNDTAEKWVAKAWKNGTVAFTSLSDGLNNAFGNSISILDNDVYVAGTDKGFATLWKNGVATSLTDKSSSASSVFVRENDIYVAGTISNSSGIAMATVWKNGVATSVSDGTIDARALSVFVYENYIYVLGEMLNYETQKSSGIVWKNNVTISQTDYKDFGSLNMESLFVK